MWNCQDNHGHKLVSDLLTLSVEVIFSCLSLSDCTPCQYYLLFSFLSGDLNPIMVAIAFMLTLNVHGYHNPGSSANTPHEERCRGKENETPPPRLLILGCPTRLVLLVRLHEEHLNILNKWYSQKGQ